ncbi:MAG: hypothetical protein NXI04_28495 [Planctomycetaceae bacterium]|nr:hypothetical protein [Planctomycetaceae bacterium]
MMLKKMVRWIGQGCAATALMAAACGADPLLTNTTSFRIPFAVDGAKDEVTGNAVLFAGFEGGPMELVNTVPASAGGFEFQADADGRYSFAVRMTDASGAVVNPGEAITPELEVIVDQIAPRLNIQLTEIATGRLNVAWTCSEQSITPDSLKLEYAEGSDGRWKLIDVAPGSMGQTTITVQAGTSVEVRGSISDLAGNQGQNAAQTVMSQAVSPVYSQAPPASAASTALSIPGSGQPVGPSPFGSAAASQPAGHPAGGHPAGGQMTATPNATASGMMAVRNNNTMPPGGLTMPGGQSMQLLPQPSPAIGAASGQTTFPQYGPVIQPGQKGFADNSPQRAGVVQFPAAESFPQTPASAVSQQYTPGGQSQQTAMLPSGTYSQNQAGYGRNFSTFASATSPASASRQTVSHPVFTIDYQVDDVGPSGVSAVELFVTENNGRTWYRYGNDADLRSPIEVDTRGEGTFGFAVRARNGLGFSQAAPQPGELPGIVVTVDRSAPQVEFSRPQVVVANGGRIRLAWRVADANPSATPVRLEYSTSESGPWTPVFDWQVDQGGYEMPIQSGMPAVLHFRLLARDVAGNVSASQTNQPVIVDQRRPTARLLRVQPVSRPGHTLGR